MILEVQDVSCGYGDVVISKNLWLNVEAGEILCLLGPNGVGKTTFFKSILGFLPLKRGNILIDGEDIKNWSQKKIARVVGYVPQAHTPPFPFTVSDVIVMGRIAHLGITSCPSKKDQEMADEVMEQLGITYLKDKIYTEISGGERQMVLIARALTQNPKVLIMDEPTSNLDFGNQIRVLKEIKKLSEKGIAVVMTSHFPDHAFLCSTAVGLFQKNDDIKVGSASEIITEDNLREAYGIAVKIFSFQDDNVGFIKSCIPVMAS